MFFLAVIISIGIYFFLNKPVESIKNERNGVVIQLFFYDKLGNPIKDTTQTAIRGVPGLFFMSLQIKVSNTGNAPLMNIRFNETRPEEFTIALQNQVPLITTLNTGQNKILFIDSANNCTSDANCAPNEKCVGSPLSCKIDISNFLGDKTFGATIHSDYSDAKGNIYTIHTPINMLLSFSQDEVVFRTNALNNDYGTSGNQIAIDSNSDSILEVYTRVGTGLEAIYSPANFVGWTPDNKLVFKCFSDRVCISRTSGLNKDQTYPNLQRDYYDLGGSLTNSRSPMEPYKSQNCGGTTPCQERYSILVAPPAGTCSDTLKNQDESDVDCGGTICPKCYLGKACVLDTDCSSNHCISNICTDVMNQYVKFRTFDLSYSGGNAVAYGTACDGTTLIRYGKTTGACSEHYCDDTNQDLLVPSSSGTTKFWFRSTDDVCICDDGVTGHSYAKRYNTGDSDATKVSNSAESINPTNEKNCP